MTLSQSDLDYIAISVAHKLAELLEEPEDAWVSQNKAWRKYGGRAHVNKLRMSRKVRTRKSGNRIEYFTKDLIKYSIPKMIKR